MNSEGAKYVCSDITCCFMFSSLDARADLSCAVLELNVGSQNDAFFGKLIFMLF